MANRFPTVMVAGLLKDLPSGDYLDIVSINQSTVDHGSIGGLVDDDHTQYHTDGRASTWLSANHETTYNHTNYNSAYSHKTTEDAINGLVKCNGAGAYSAVVDSSTNWNTAYGWGNHATAGYLTSEVDTLNSVVVRGSSTAGAITVGGLTNSALTSGRVVIASTAGLLADDADLTFDGNRLTTKLTCPAGTITAGTAPVKLTSGTSLTTAEVGAVEFTTDDLYFTITTSAARKGIILNEGTNLTSGKVPVATTNGRLRDATALTYDINNGRLGIGIDATTPLFPLHVQVNQNAVTYFIVTNSTNDTASGSGFELQSASNGIGAIVYGFAHATRSNQAQFYSAGGITQFDFASQGATGYFTFSTQGTGVSYVRMTLTTEGRLGVGVAAPTAMLHLKAGTATASTAPLKFTSGVSLTAAEAGSVEFTTDDLYFTITTGAARKGFVLNDGTNLTSGRIPFATTNGRLADDADLTFATDTLTVTNTKITDTLTVPKTSGKGIKVDTSSPTFGYRDILGDIKILSPGANDPTLATFRNSLKQFSFSNAVTNEVFLTFHIPHDYVPSSDLFIHTHWSQNVVDTGGPAAAPGDVKWQFEVSYAKGHNQAAFPASFTTSVTQTASGTQYQHMLTEIQLSAVTPSATQIDSDIIEPDGIILIRAFRDPTDVADTLNQVPFLHYVDIHYQSTNIATKAKAPNFYT